MAKYKQYVTYGIGYFYIIGSLGLLVEMNVLAIPLLIVHVLQSLLFDNPWVTSTQNEYETKLRALIFDVCILAGVLMIMGVSREDSEAQRRRVEQERANDEKKRK